MSEDPVASLFGSDTSPSIPQVSQPSPRVDTDTQEQLDKHLEVSDPSPEEILRSAQGFPDELYLYHDLTDHCVKAKCINGGGLYVLQILNTESASFPLEAQKLHWTGLKTIKFSLDPDKPQRIEGILTAAIFFGHLSRRILKLGCPPSLHIQIQTTVGEFEAPKNVTEHLNIICSQLAALYGSAEGIVFDRSPLELIQQRASPDDQTIESAQAYRYHLRGPHGISITIEAYGWTSSKDVSDLMYAHYCTIVRDFHPEARFRASSTPWSYDLPTEIIQKILWFLVPEEVNVELREDGREQYSSEEALSMWNLLRVDRRIRAAAVDLLTKKVKWTLQCQDKLSRAAIIENALTGLDKGFCFSQCRSLTLKHAFSWHFMDGILHRDDKVEAGSAGERARDRAAKFISCILCSQGAITDQNVAIGSQYVASIGSGGNISIEIQVKIQHAGREMILEFHWPTVMPWSNMSIDEGSEAVRTLKEIGCVDWIARFDREIRGLMRIVMQRELTEYVVTGSPIVRLILKGIGSTHRVLVQL